jgi:hypothetical protein
MMGPLIAGAVALLILLWVVGKFTGGDPRRLAGLARQYGKQVVGAALLALCAFMAARGNWMAVAVLAPVGLGLLKAGPWAAGPWAQNSKKSSGQRSVVRAAYVEMTLDHDTGDLRGQVIAGSYAGQNLDDLDEAGLGTLLREIAPDADSVNLVEAYLDRRFPGRRPDVDENAGARQRGAGSSQAMTEEEAYQILGLEPGADAEAIRTAHRALMKRLHPDQGGSTWLAAKVNLAKDMLLRSHR